MIKEIVGSYQGHVVQNFSIKNKMIFFFFHFITSN